MTTILTITIIDWRFTSYLPSVLATATMLHVIHQLEPTNAIEYHNQLLAILRTTKVSLPALCNFPYYFKAEWGYERVSLPYSRTYASAEISNAF